MTSTDMISQLPDSMLHHIMSFMKANAAVRTCVLSKRWRRLWASLKHLHFDYSEFLDRRESYAEHYVDRYYKFISRMLQERENIDVHTFDMDYFYKLHDDDNARAREWIGYAVDHNARVIHFPSVQLSNLPQSIYTCASLEEVHVPYGNIAGPIIYPASVSLPRLRSLDLDLSGVDHQYLKSVIMQCPALEVLSLSFCSSIDLSGIPFYKLRKLSFKYCDVFSEAGKLSAPSLEFFSFVRGVNTLNTLRVLGIESMPSWTYVYFYQDYGIVDAFLNKGNCNILGSLSNAHKLKNPLKEELQNCSIVFNVLELDICGCASCHSNMIARMLKISGYLRKLTIRHSESSIHEVEKLNCKYTTIKGAVLKSKDLDTIEIHVQPPRTTALKPLIEDLVESLQRGNKFIFWRKRGNKLFKVSLIFYKYSRDYIGDLEALCSSLAQDIPQINLSYKLIPK